MTQPLTDFIASLRLSDSIEHERFLVASEQADMRSYIRECDPTLRPRIVAKLVFLSTIGENVAYGQMEVLTLMSHDLFSYKRIGYMAASVILDESSEIAVLITHTILKDLQNTSDFRIQCLALGLLANIGSTEMCQSVSTEVQKIISQSSTQPHISSFSSSSKSSHNGNPMLMKRAAMAAVRIIEKIPDLAENFKQSAQKLLKHGSHGVVIAGVNLMAHIIQADSSFATSWQRYAPAFTKILKQIAQSKPSREFTFTVFNDPFLQIRLMKILILLNKQSDELDDVLEMITTGSDFRRNTGRSLLFQAVETIVAVAKKSSLRGLAFSQVGRLFQFKEANVLYSALSCFSRVLYQGNEIIGRTSGDNIALQRYKTQVVRCLNHRDPSIRRRALDVVSALVDEKNVDTLIPEVLDYVRLSDSFFRVELVAKIFTAIQRFAPTVQWNFNIVHRILIENGNYVGSDIITSFVRLITNHPELQAHAVALFSGSLAEEPENQTLVQVGSYIIGEYMYNDSNNNENLNSNSAETMDTDEMSTFELMKKIVNMPQTIPLTKGYIITALAKLASRFGKTDEICDFMKTLNKSNNLDVQQRAGEIERLMKETEILNDVLAPLVISNENDASKLIINDNDNNNNNNDNNNRTNKEEDDLLIDIDLSQPQSTDLLVNSNNEKQSNAESTANDLLSLDLSNSNNNDNINKPNNNDISNVKIQPPKGAVEGLRKPDYVMYFEIRKNPANQKQIALRVSVFNLGKVPLNNFQIKFGVPVGWYLQSQPPSSKTLEPIGGQPIFQQLMVATQTDKPLMMKVQIFYLFGSQPITETGEINPIFG